MSTINLDYTRFVRQTTNGSARSKYGYLGMQQELANQIENTPWKQASCQNNLVGLVTNKVTETDEVKDEQGVILKPATYTALLKDNFDAFKQGGDANKDDATFCGYCGAVCYRFNLPENYDTDIQNIAFRVAASRYLRSGVRVAVQIKTDPYPSEDWSVIRGEGAGAIVTNHEASDVEGVKSWGVLGQQSANTLLQSQAREELIQFSADDFPAIGTHTRHAYIFVYLTIEDMTDYWVLYDNNTPRYYSIEGSAMIVGSTFAVTFDGEVSPTALVWVDASAITEDLNMPNRELQQLPDRGDGYVDDIGNLGEFTMATGAYTMIDGERSYPQSLAALQRFSVYPRKDFFSFKGLGCPTVIEQQTQSSPLVDEFNTFSAFRNEFTRSGSKWQATDVYKGDIGINIYNRSMSTSSALINKRVALPERLLFRSRLATVPIGEVAFQRIRVKATLDQASGAMECGLNIWVSDSPDMIGTWSLPLGSIMASHQEMFGSGNTTIHAELEANGNWFKDSEGRSTMKLTGDCKYIGFIPMATDTSREQTVDVLLNEQVFPGQKIIIAPRLLRLTGEYVETGSGHIAPPNWSISGPNFNVYFAK